MSNVSHSKSQYEKSDVNPIKLFIAAFVVILVIVLIIIAMNDYFVVSKEKLVEEVVLKPVSQELRELRAQEEEILTTYKVLDAEKGIYRIPIDRAMKVLSEESFQKKLKNRQ